MIFDFLYLKAFVEICVSNKLWGICNYSKDFVTIICIFFMYEDAQLSITACGENVCEKWAYKLKNISFN